MENQYSYHKIFWFCNSHDNLYHTVVNPDSFYKIQSRKLRNTLFDSLPCCEGRNFRFLGYRSYSKNDELLLDGLGLWYLHGRYRTDGIYPDIEKLVNESEYIGKEDVMIKPARREK